MLQQIHETLPALSRAQRQVGRWILDHPRRAAHAAVAEVAAAAGTSQPTVIRFCRSVGVSGFRELKIRLAEAIGRPESYLHRDVERRDSGRDAAVKVIERSIQTLIDARPLAETLPVDEAVALLCGARQVVFVGSGASGHVAADACHKFFRLGLACTSTSDVPTMLQQTAVAAADDLFVLVSQSGLSQGVLRAADNARRRGAGVLALTDAASPLAAQATLLLACPAHEDPNVYTPMSSRLVQLALLDALQVATALALGQPAEDRLRRSKLALAAARHGPD